MPWKSTTKRLTDDETSYLTSSRVLLLEVLVLWMNIVAQDETDYDSFIYPEDVPLRDEQTFDYIVVGAGAAGCTVAAQLALAGQHVLLIEAGDNPDIRSQIPSITMSLVGSNVDWQYKTISNKMSCLSSDGQQCRFSRGKCLGGSTSINYMLYVRGNKKDFDDINYPGWSYNDLLPYFLRYEGLQDLDQLPSSSKPYHNTTGTMRIGFFNDPQNPWHSRLVTSFTSLGFPYNPDVNAKSQIGVSKVIGYVYRGQRMSTARGYLAKADVRKRLLVAKNTLCTGVIINEQNVTLGVSVNRGLLSLRIYAQKEVILSAGTIGTPQILMLSGIGPADHLKNIGIPVKADLPVGDGMTDHALPVLVFLVDNGTGLIEGIGELVKKSAQQIELLVAQGGPITSNGLTDICIFANTYCYDSKQKRLLNVSSDGSDCEVPNVQIINAYVDRYMITSGKPQFKQEFNFDDDVVEQLSEANKNHAFVLMLPALLNPRSVGTVRLASMDPLVPPAVFPNFLAEEEDVDNIVRSIGIAEDILETLPFKEQNVSILHLNLPGCPLYEVDRQGYWKCYTRHMTFTVFHSTGTASLTKVVDARLRVFGVQRLRVADLSVLPRVPRGNTEAVTIGIGERLVDFLLKDNK